MSNPDSPEYSPAVGEIDLAAYVPVIWRARWVILLGTLAAGALAFGLTALRSPQFSASAMLMVNNQREGGSLVNVESFTTLLTSRALARDVIEASQLDIGVQRFARQLDVEPVRGTNLLRATLRLGDPDLVATVANLFAEKAVDLNRELNQQEAASTRDFLKSQLDLATERLQEAEEALLAYQRDAQVELARKDAEALLGERLKLIPLLVEIEGERARLEKAEEELAKREQVLSLRRFIDGEPVLMESARQTVEGAESLLNLGMRSEHVSGVYQLIDEQVATSRATLSALQRQHEELVEVLHVQADQNPQLSDLYEKEIELSRLRRDYEIAQQSHGNLVTRYEQARIAVESRRPELQIVDPAVRPERPGRSTSPLAIGFVMIAAFLGLMVGVLTMDFVRKSLRSS